MPCYTPLKAYITPGKTVNGRKLIKFSKQTFADEEIQLPCGRCIGCRLRNTATWAMRIMHESTLHEDNCFITLTYDDEKLPGDYSLNKPHFQKFMKRLRKAISPKKVRFFMCGEYGDKTWRPHFHAAIFGYDFPDKYRVQMVETDHPYYISPVLSNLWKFGFHVIAPLEFDSAAYIASYVTKKITGDKAESHYKRTIMDFNEVTGELSTYYEADLLPEYATMSNRPGIGKEWYEKYKNDCYPSNFLIKDGVKMPIPRYYDNLLERENPELLERCKEARKEHINPEYLDHNRLRQMNEYAKAQFNQQKQRKI